MRTLALVTIVSALFGAPTNTLGQEIVLDSVGSFWSHSGDTIMSGGLIKFYIRYNNNTEGNVRGFINGYRIYSIDGAQWTTSAIDTPANASIRGWGGEQFPYQGPFTGIWFGMYNVDGLLSDTVAILGFSLDELFGSAAGFNDLAAIVTIGPIPPALYDGKHICIDSSWAPPGNDWAWAVGPPVGNVYAPAWDGPYCYTIFSEITGVDDDTELPRTFSLSQNYPNPFNPTTSIDYSLAEKSQVELSVYSVVGQRVRTLVDGVESAGSYSKTWDGTSSTVAQVASGVYFYRLKTEKFTSTKKMMLVK